MNNKNNNATTNVCGNKNNKNIASMNACKRYYKQLVNT